MEGYCMKCKKKNTMEKPKEVTGANGRVRMEGKCAECGTKMCVFVAAKKPAK
jgi:hypothetical protein